MRLDDRTLPVQTRHAADGAAARAGVVVSDELALADFRTAADLFEAVWLTRDRAAPVTGEFMRALSYEGNYVACAFRDGRLVGASVAFLYGSGSPLALHSHITGVLAGDQGRGAGFALKQHQRAWSLDRGITTARWTFDPLVRRNAFFNLVKLGAELTEFLPNFYGTMDDGLNAGDDSDRGLIAWQLDSDRAIEAASGRTQEAVPEGVAALDVDDEGRPVQCETGAAARLIRVPDDFTSVRSSDPGVGRAWRVALRETMSRALDDGLRVTGFTRDGWYVLS